MILAFSECFFNRKISIFFLCCTLSLAASCQPATKKKINQQIPAYSLSDKLNLLVRDEGIKGYFEVNDSSVVMYSDTLNKSIRQPEAEIFFSESDFFLNLTKTLSYDSLQEIYLSKGTHPFDSSLAPDSTSLQSSPKAIGLPLSGKRIALDPGHIGGSISTAILEDRYVKSVYKGDTLVFAEPNLTLATAYLLKEKLEKAGAEVLLTRAEYGKSSFDKTITEWIKEDLELTIQKELADEHDPLDPFLAKMLREKQLSDSSYVHDRFFKYADFKKRAEKINAFQPDLTFIIHYNVDSPNYEKRSPEGVFPLGGKNYSMAFVPGSFMRRELQDVRSRIEFLRLLLSDNLSQSVHAADMFEKFHQKILNIQPVEETSELPYLVRGCVYAGKKGVYARNLSLTRMVHSPLVYGESLCQDHKKEVRLLAKQEIMVHGRKMPKRIEKVAEAYFQTTLSFFQK